MTNRQPQQTTPTIVTLSDLAKLANYSLMDTLNCDPDATENGVDHLSKTLSTLLTVKLFSVNSVFPTAWRSPLTSFDCSLAT
jgi:hypothetical protein